MRSVVSRAARPQGLGADAKRPRNARHGGVRDIDKVGWEGLNTMERAEALLLAGAPSHWDGDEFVSYEPLPWGSLPRHVRAALRQLLASWQLLPRGPLH